jgi:hypothetical protein
MADYERPDLRELIEGIRRAFPHSLYFGLINAFHLLLLTLVVPFYYQMGGVVGLAALSLIFWVSIAWWLAGQWFFPLLVQLPGDITLFLALHSGFTFLVSILTALLMPGISSIVMARQGALRLLLLKYDYLEEHPDANRKDIPWDALLVEDRELVGTRTLKGMIFPWKE